MNNIMQMETLLNLLNTIFAKAVHCKDEASIQQLVDLRHSFYYSDNFDCESCLVALNRIDLSLKDMAEQ